MIKEKAVCEIVFGSGKNDKLKRRDGCFVVVTMMASQERPLLVPMVVSFSNEGEQTPKEIQTYPREYCREHAHNMEQFIFYKIYPFKESKKYITYKDNIVLPVYI